MKAPGNGHPETLTSLSNLATALGQQDKYEEVETMHRQALEGHKKVLGREHPPSVPYFVSL